MPTVGHDTVGTGFQDEVKAIQDAVAEYVNREKDVILVSPSYGGWPRSRAVKGWDKPTRELNNETIGIVELVFLGAFLLPENALTEYWDTLVYWITSEVGSCISSQLYTLHITGLLETSISTSTLAIFKMVRKLCFNIRELFLIV